MKFCVSGSITSVSSLAIANYPKPTSDVTTEEGLLCIFARGFVNGTAGGEQNFANPSMHQFANSLSGVCS